MKELIDFIKVGKPLPVDVPDDEFVGTDIHSCQSLGVGHSVSLCYTFVPYYSNNFNYGEVTRNCRDAISSRFTGCLMVAWEENWKIFAGHVQTVKDRKPHDCRDLWEAKEVAATRSFSFVPSNVQPTPADGQHVPNCYGFIIFDETFSILAAFSVVTDCYNIVTQKELVYKGAFTGHIVI